MVTYLVISGNIDYRIFSNKTKQGEIHQVALVQTPPDRLPKLSPVTR